MFDSHSSYVIERTELPRFMQAGWVDHSEALYDLTGEQIEWGHAIPPMYQLLNAPSRTGVFLRKPHPHELELELGYWSALLHLLLYSFGWSNPGRGLLRWYQTRRPADDVRFRLLTDLWLADGSLDAFTFWLLTGGESFVALEPATLAGQPPPDTSGQEYDRAWLATWLAAAATEQTAGDGLHLAVHCGGPLEEVRVPSALLNSSKADRRAVLIVDSMRGWYRTLSEVKLPDLGDRSWYVDVVAKPVGHLGTFRRSRETGRYFAGPHRYHILGN